ncbi:MAG: HAD family hydrolase [Clostridia bacterium]|nr:HAD family hydrolase [Clostridia bacterium]
MTSPKFKCAIFDLDGTLLYTLKSINTAINETLRLCGYPEHPLENTVNLVNFGTVDLVRRALPEDKRTDEEIARVHELYLPRLKKHASVGTMPYDGISEVCKKLKESGVTVCVMSNKSDGATKACIDTYFEKGLFDVVRGSVPGEYLKPDAKFTEEVVKEAGAKKEDCVLIGDSIVDLRTAKNADCPCIWVSWGYAKKETLDIEPQYIADKPEDILSVILG